MLRIEPGNITRTDSTTLDTTRQAQERQTKEHLATSSRGRDEDPKPQLQRYHPEARPEQTGEEDLSCSPSYQRTLGLVSK